ncbi:MAG: imidazole glycerol phosphate synthase subunit HisH [Hydrogenothermus sp.]|nr:MAG: imidazole glycerol phosphate synthase subunit HisH [Hydrogenothermus sp.]
MITVVDYGMGNLRSVAKAFEAVGASVKVSSKPEDIKNSKAIVVPGVGAFGDAIKHLKELNLYDEIINHVNNKKPYFGICLGLQILFEKGYEFGEHKGLGIIKGKVIRFKQKEGYKIPHMGWNQVSIKQKNGLFTDIKNSEFFYFVHSFYVVPEDSKVVASTTDYINEFCSSIQIDNIWAVQFHPEKSQKAGLKLIKNFVEKVNTL